MRTLLARAAAALGLRPDPPSGWSTRELGRRGERAAARFLRRAGYRIAARNVRARIGEADLVCLAPDRLTIVVVEVKTRLLPRGVETAPVPPEANIHAAKRRKLFHVTRTLSRLNRWQGRPVRIDIIAVEWPDTPRAAPTIRHYPDALR